MTADQARRLAYCVRARVEKAALRPGMKVEAFAEAIGDELVLYLNATIPGRVVTIDAPTNRWHALLFALGLPYKRKTLEVSADGTD